MLKRIWICTSKHSILYRMLLIQTGTKERNAVENCFQEDLSKRLEDESIKKFDRNALIDSIPYYVDFKDITQTSFIHTFKDRICELLSKKPKKQVRFKRVQVGSEIVDFEENEGLKFLIAQNDKNLYFLYTQPNSVIKNRSILSISINSDASVVEVPKGIQIPRTLTARYDVVKERLYVYDVERFESMLSINENMKAKSEDVIRKFSNHEYRISQEDYKIEGLSEVEVRNKIFQSARAVRRLAKYDPQQIRYPIEQIKVAVEKLEPRLQVAFDVVNKKIIITPETATTFVGIIHNSIIQRLISGEIEITL